MYNAPLVLLSVPVFKTYMSKISNLRKFNKAGHFVKMDFP